MPTPTTRAQELGPTTPVIVPDATPAKVYLPLIQRGLTNLISNGGFESGNLNGWEANGAAASMLEAHTGRWSARVSTASMRVFIPTVPNQMYKVTAWIKIASDRGDDWGGFSVAVHDRNWRPLAELGPMVQSSRGGDWFKVALQFTADQAVTPLDIGYFGGSGRQMVAYVDDVLVFSKGDNRPPTLTATLTPSLSSLPQTQTFSLIADDIDGAVARVLWDFGDGARALQWSGSRRVALPGSYLATITIADDEGAVTTQTFPWTAASAGFPALTVSAPALAETTVSVPTLTVTGSASGAASVQVSTDRGFSGAVSGLSNWSVNVPLQPGVNRILVQARGADGRIVTQERNVRFTPSGALALGSFQHAQTVELWESLTITFALQNSGATYPQFPYDAEPPPGLQWLEGVTVDALFTPDNWATVYRRPAFLFQPYERALKDGREWIYQSGSPVWMVRFAPPLTGAWKFRLEATEAKGHTQSVERSFTVTAPMSPTNHGAVRVAPADSRYFEFADGTPFLGAGHSLGFESSRFSYDAVDQFNVMGTGNQQFFRWWLSGQALWTSAWGPWRSRTLSGDGYIPATGLTLDRAYGHGLAALRLDAANPIMFTGFDSGHPALIPGRTYRVRVRWRTENVTGPQVGGQPFGVTVKLTGWPEPGQTGSTPALVPHTSGDTPWHVASGDFTAGADFIQHLALILENASGGAAYIDEVTMYEVLSGGALGPQLLRNPRFNSHLTFDLVRSAGVDAILSEASARGLYFKLVISEKNEYLLNHLGPDGLPEPLGAQFDGEAGTPVRWLHEAYWRYLFARFGAYRSVHSWELVNEAAPGPGDHFRLTAALASAAAADGNPHLAATSTWATLAEEAWLHPDSAPIPYADFHAYVRGTGWIDPKDQLAHDSARFFAEYDRAARAAGFNKPIVWGEMGIDGVNGTDHQEPLLADDINGVWLHKLTWARTGPGGVYPVYWYTDHIFSRSLHSVFGAWNRFMAGLPLANGRYQDANAAASHPDLRVLGQKDLQSGWAHLWIDNRQHTWWMVVNGTAVLPVSGGVTVALQRPNASYTVTWYSTQTGQPTSTQILSANASGVLSLSINGLSTDTAVRMTWNGN